MQIHNFYSDVLLSVRLLFDNHIFRSDLIKSYSFNIANRSIELSKNDYTTNYEFPAAIVRLDDDQYHFGERPNVIQHHAVENINMIPVLVDLKTGNKIFVQEEHVNININISINCESQFQAKEMEFAIKRVLPANKRIQLLKFTSFLEIPSEILLNHDINFNDNEVANLFIKMNRNLGNIEHCYSLQYEPIINLASINTNISDSSQRSFSVECQLIYSIQMPMWLIFDKYASIVKRINLDFTRFGNEPISDNSMRPVFGKTKHDKYADSINVVKRNLVVYSLDEFSLTKLDGINPKYIFAIQFLKDDFKLSNDYKINIFDIESKFHHDVKPTIIDETVNEIRFQFSQYEIDAYFNATLTRPIIIQFVNIRKFIDNNDEQENII